MSWQDKGRRAAMGKFVRAKAERMVLITFQGEPTEHVGKNFNQEPVDELHFPVKFYDERSVGQRYETGEAARIVMSEDGEDKIFPVSSPPLMRELLAEDEQESIMDRTFIISHTGAAANTEYKFREIKVTKQASLTELKKKKKVTVEEEEAEEEETEEETPKAGPHPRKDQPKPPTRKRRTKEEIESGKLSGEALGEAIVSHLESKDKVIPWLVASKVNAANLNDVIDMMTDLGWGETVEMDPKTKMPVWRPKQIEEMTG